MPRHISFAMTTEQIITRRKNVTRRLGWHQLTPGTVLIAVEKGMGLSKGEKVRKLCRIVVTEVRREQLGSLVNREECAAEGFPELLPSEFVAMFCRHNDCTPNTWVTRIAFEYLEGPADE